jgi:hypothetical protein
MDDIAAGEPPCPCDDGIPRTHWALGHGVALDLDAADPFYGPGHTAAHPQVCVGGVDDGVDREGGDVAALDPKGGMTYPMLDRCPEEEEDTGDQGAPPSGTPAGV